MWTTPKVLGLFGLPPGGEPDDGSFLKVIHPEDQARVGQTFSQAVRSGGEFSIENQSGGGSTILAWVPLKGEFA